MLSQTGLHLQLKRIFHPASALKARGWATAASHLEPNSSTFSLSDRDFFCTLCRRHQHEQPGTRAASTGFNQLQPASERRHKTIKVGRGILRRWPTEATKTCPFRKVHNLHVCPLMKSSRLNYSRLSALNKSLKSLAQFLTATFLEIMHI